VEPEKRPVTIYDLTLDSWEPPFAQISVRCSKGVYIRSLARDLALEARSRAHLVSLRRTAVARFSIEDAVRDEALDFDALKPVSPAVFRALEIPVLETDAVTAESLVHGKPLSSLLGRLALPHGTEKAAAVFDKDANLIAMLTQEGGRWAYGYVYARG
jgi:tRNA pseudouridine55 synthase